jgi:DNA polymerase III delta subunit
MAVILISGEEELLMERAAYEEAQLSLSEETLEFTADNIDEYLQESQCSLLGGGKRTYIIWDAKEVPAPPESPHDTLVVVSKKPISHPGSKRALKFPKLKTFAENNEVLSWILKEGEAHNIDLKRVAGALFMNSGSSLRKLATEIEKLALVVPPGSVVSPEVVRPLLCFSAELTPKEIVDALCDGQTPRALAFFDKLQERADETGWILAFLQRHVLQQLRFELFVERKVPNDRAAITLGVHPFILNRMYVTRKGLWTKQSLLQSIDTLCDLDVAHKRGSPWARIGLELEIVRLCEEAKDVKR